MKGGILFISPSVEDARSLEDILNCVGISVRQATSYAMARKALEKESFSAVLTESRLPDGNWDDVVTLVGKMRPGVAVVVADKLADARLWADGLQLGAYDLLAKPFYPGEVQRVIARAVHEPPQLMRAAPAA